MEIRLNLIPPSARDEIIKKRKLKLIFKIELATFVMALILLAVLISYSYVLGVEYSLVSSNLESKRNEQQYEKIKKYDEEFSQANTQTKEIAALEKDQLYWSNAFDLLSKNISEGIEIGSFSTKELSIFLAGEADTRDNLIFFKEKLEKENCFSDVNLPLSNLVSRDNVAFQIDLKINEECVKNGAKK